MIIVTGTVVARAGQFDAVLAIATERATGAQCTLLRRVGSPDLTDAEVVDLQAVLVATGALAELEGVIEVLTLEAIASLDSTPITDDSRKALVDLAHYVDGFVEPYPSRGFVVTTSTSTWFCAPTGTEIYWYNTYQYRQR